MAEYNQQIQVSVYIVTGLPRLKFCWCSGLTGLLNCLDMPLTAGKPAGSHSLHMHYWASLPHLLSWWPLPSAQEAKMALQKKLVKIQQCLKTLYSPFSQACSINFNSFPSFWPLYEFQKEPSMGMILSSPTDRKSKNCRDARRNCFHCKSWTKKCLQRNAIPLEADIHLLPQHKK